MVDNSTISNNRSAVIDEPRLLPTSNGLLGVGSDPLLRTPYAGNVRALPPPLPPAPTHSQYGATNFAGYANNYGSAFGSGYGVGFSGYGGGFSGYGGGVGGGGYGGGYSGFGSSSFGAFNRFGASGSMNPMYSESRFIQLAEASSRPAFESIESLVSAIGNIAAMLDSTFFALTSSFRALLGVAANFGRLRGVFAQFWQTFAIFRIFAWIYRKLLYWLRISNMDPSSQSFKKAFADAINETSAQSGAPKLPRKGQSPWPVVAFLSFIFTAPYIIMKLLGTVTNTAQTEARDPSKWVQPVETVATYDFQARNSSELTVRSDGRLLVAPKEVQNTLGLLNTGWALATVDGQTAGIVPINYLKSPAQLRQERQQLVPHPALSTNPSSAFAQPPLTDFDIATQPLITGPPTMAEAAF